MLLFECELNILSIAVKEFETRIEKLKFYLQTEVHRAVANLNTGRLKTSKGFYSKIVHNQKIVQQIRLM